MTNTSEPVRQLAIIRNAHRAIEDHAGVYAIVFDAYITEGSAALQVVLPRDERFASLWDALGGGDGCVSLLNGKSAWVEVTPGMVIFKEIAKL